MFKVALKGVLARKGRVVTTAIAVLLGVAFVTGTLVLSDTITKVFNDLFADVNEGTDALVRARSRRSTTASAPTSAAGSTRACSTPSWPPTVSPTPTAGINNSGYAQFVDEDGEAIGNPNQGAPTLGFSWPRWTRSTPSS